MAKEIIIKSPVKGKIKNIKNVNDPVFSQEMMGKTIAIIPADSNFVSPIDGKLKVAFPTGHAFGIENKKGIEILLHIGIDTVELNGEGFESKATQGDKVKVGSTLVLVDLDKVKKLGKEIDTVIVLTNQNDYHLEITGKGEVNAGDEIAKLTKN